MSGYFVDREAAPVIWEGIKAMLGAIDEARPEWLRKGEVLLAGLGAGLALGTVRNLTAQLWNEGWVLCEERAPRKGHDRWYKLTDEGAEMLDRMMEMDDEEVDVFGVEECWAGSGSGSGRGVGQ